VLFVDEIPGLIFPAGTVPSAEANQVLQQATIHLDGKGITAVPVWRVGHRAGEAIGETAELLDVKEVVIGTSKRTPLWKLLRGSVVRDLKAGLPAGLELSVIQYGASPTTIPRESPSGTVP
jgi:nucleotide-binding universal stress UspA family protein